MRGLVAQPGLEYWTFTEKQGFSVLEKGQTFLK